MANRTLNEFQGTMEKGLVSLFAEVAFNGSGTPTLQQWDPATGKYSVAASAGFRGIKSVARNGVGDYTVTLQDSYLRLLGASITLVGSANAAAPLCQVKVASNPNAAGASTGSGAVRGATPTINLLFFSAQGTAADPAATELGIIAIQLSNSAAL